MGSGGVRSSVSSREKMLGNLESIITYHRKRGWQENPSLEDKDPSQITSFAKPLPDGRRIHRRLYKGRKYYTIIEHVDKSDPNRDPIGHMQDILNPPKHRRIRVKRTDFM